MRQFWIYGRRLLEWILFWAIGHGIILFLATREIYPDKFVASMITKASEAPIWADWIISGIFGLLITFGLEIFFWNPRSLVRPSNMNHTAGTPVHVGTEAGCASALIGSPLKIDFGHGANYETKQACGLYKTTHTFMIAIKNSNPQHFLSNCKLYLDIADQDGGAQESYLLVDAFTLNATEERYVPIVSYDEPATVSRHAGTHIRLHIPIHGGFYNIGYGWPWQMPVGAYTFTLRAISKETGHCEVVCKILVDDTGKLHFEKA